MAPGASSICATRIRRLATVNLLSFSASSPLSGSFTSTRTTPSSPVLAMETARIFRPPVGEHTGDLLQLARLVHDEHRQVPRHLSTPSLTGRGGRPRAPPCLRPPGGFRPPGV